MRQIIETRETHLAAHVFGRSIQLWSRKIGLMERIYEERLPVKVKEKSPHIRFR